jgi:hypothetical protein
MCFFFFLLRQDRQIIRSWEVKSEHIVGRLACLPSLLYFLASSQTNCTYVCIYVTWLGLIHVVQNAVIALHTRTYIHTYICMGWFTERKLYIREREKRVDFWGRGTRGIKKENSMSVMFLCLFHAHSIPDFQSGLWPIETFLSRQP